MDEFIIVSTMNHVEKLTRDVKQHALEIGFSEVGVADARLLLSHEAERYQEWLSLGYHGTMSYLERNAGKRENLDEILPGARSVIVVTQNYYTPFTHEKHKEYPDEFGKISRYAWGDDYHEVIPPKLRQVAAFIERLSPGSESKIYTDTGPILEKAWAVRAGIGWQGKHSNVISKSRGSWFFIGVIITSAVLEPDEQVNDYCGTCTACIDACPTSAIVEPYVVDGTKCLSYWTIEAKPEVEIPLDIVQNMDGWIFGCDVCQEVCPWNRFKVETPEKKFLPRNDQTCLEFTEVNAYTQEDFSLRYRKSPVKRTKLAGLQRNVKAVSLSNHLKNK